MSYVSFFQTLNFLKGIDVRIEKNGQPTSIGHADMIDKIDNIATVKVTLEDFIDFHHLYTFDSTW